MKCIIFVTLGFGSNVFKVKVTSSGFLFSPTKSWRLLTLYQFISDSLSVSPPAAGLYVKTGGWSPYLCPFNRQLFSVFLRVYDILF